MPGDAGDPALEVQDEFDRQLGHMLALGYPALAGLDVTRFVRDVEECRPAAHQVGGGSARGPVQAGRVPFVLVPILVSVAAALSLTRLEGGTRPGVLDRNHGEAGLDRFFMLAGSRATASGMVKRVPGRTIGP